MSGGNAHQAGKSAAKKDDGDLQPLRPQGAPGPQAAELPDGLRRRIDVIRSAAARRNGSAVQSERPIAMLETWLLDDEQKNALAYNALNFFYLEAAAYLKPVKGMAEYGPDLGIPDPSEAKVISRIVHASEQLAEDRRPAWSADAGGWNSGIHAHLLAGALALAERLDLHHPATLEKIGRRITERTKSYKEDWSGAFDVQSMGPQPGQPGTMLVCIHCRDVELHSSLKHYETDVERFIGGLNKRIRPRFAFSKVRFEIQASGYEPMDYKFSVDGAAALRLFMGHTLYGDKRVFLRELVQNAVDACHLRGLLEPVYTPAIFIDLNAAEDRIAIKDNGIGMDRRWLEKYFLNVGISFYRSGEADDLSIYPALQRSFISNFGIGFLSTFLIADRILVKTRKKGAEGLLIAITDIGDYFDVRPAKEDLPIGTEVILELKSPRIKSWRGMEFLGYLKRIARFVSIPIRFTDATGHATIIGRESLNWFGADLSGHNFSAPFQVAPSQGCVLIRARGEGDRIFGLDSASGGLSIFQNGIFVTQTDDLLPAKARRYVIGRLNLAGEHVGELSMDRHRIFWPPGQLRFFRRAVLTAIAQTAGHLLNTVAQSKVTPQMRQKIELTLASFFEITTVDDALFQTLPQSIRRLLQQQFRSFLRTSVSRSYRPGTDLSDIAEAQGFQYEWQKSVIAAMAH